MKKIILIIVAVATVSMTASAYSSNVGQNQKSKQTAMTNVDEQAMLKVEGNCDVCKARIEKAALGVNGVSWAQWDANTQELGLKFDPAKTNLAAISKAVAKVGHDTAMNKADNKVYDALPDCCKYRK